jgi:hypothetical protein
MERVLKLDQKCSRSGTGPKWTGSSNLTKSAVGPVRVQHGPDPQSLTKNAVGPVPRSNLDRILKLNKMYIPVQVQRALDSQTSKKVQ